MAAPDGSRTEPRMVPADCAFIGNAARRATVQNRSTVFIISLSVPSHRTPSIVSAGFSKPKKKLVAGQKRKMSELIIGMSGSPYHLGSMIALPSDVLVFTARDFLLPRRKNQAAFDRHASIGSIRDAKLTKTLDLFWTRLQLATSTEF